MSHFPRLICSGSIAAFLLGFGHAPKAQALNIYWTGTSSGIWANGNWSPNQTGVGTTNSPGGSDVAIFNSDAVSNQITTLGGSKVVGGIQFLSNAPTRTIDTVGLFTLTINTSGITLMSGAAAQTINDNVTINASQSWTNSSDKLLTIGGALTLVSFVGTPATLTAAAGSTGGILLNGGVNVSVSGNGLTNNNTSAALTVGGTTTINSTGDGSGGYTFNLGGTGALNIGGIVVNKDVGNGQVPNVGFTNTINVTGTGAKTLNDLVLSTNEATGQALAIATASGAGLSINGVISNGTATVNLPTLLKSGVGTLTLAGANTFTGTLRIDDGTVAIATTGSLATNSLTLLPNAGSTGTPTLTVAGAATRLPTSITYGQAGGANIGGTATFSATGAGSYTTTAGATITLNLAHSTNGATGGNDALISAPLVNNGASAIGFNKTGVGTLRMTGNNSYTGTFTISQGTAIVTGSQTAAGGLTLAPNNGGAADNISTLAIDSGAIYLLGGTLTVNGTTATNLPGVQIKSNTGNGTIKLSSAANTNQTIRTFTIGDNANAALADEITISVPIVDGFTQSGIYKDGPGQIRLTGNNTYTGATDFFRGNLVIDYLPSATEKLSNTGDIEPRGGTLTLSGNASTAVAETVGFLSPGGSNVIGGSFAFNSTTASTGGTSTINLTSVSGVPLSLTFSGFRHNPGGGIVNLTTTGANTEFRTTAANDSGGLLATNAFLNGRWIANSNNANGTIVQAFGTVENIVSNWQSTQSIEVTGATSNGLAVNRIDALTFSGGNATVAVDGASNPGGTGALTITSGGILKTAGSGNSTALISGGRLIAELPYATAASAELILANFSTGVLKVTSNVSGSDAPLGNIQNITIAGTGIVELAGKSSSIPTYNQGTRLFGQVNVLGGATLRVSGGSTGADPIGDYLPINLGLNGDTSGTFVLADGETETIGGVVNAANGNQGTTQGIIDMGTGGVLTLNQNLAATYSGFIRGTGATLIKQGGGALTISPAITPLNSLLDYSGTLQILGGLIQFTSTNTTAASTAGFTQITSVLLRGGEIVSQQNAGSDMFMIPNAATIQMEGTSGNGLRVTGNQNATRNETVGTLSLGAGANTITIETQAGTSTSTLLTLNVSTGAAGLTRTGGATMLVRGTNLGAASGLRTGITFNNAAALNNTFVGGGGGDGTNTISILPYAVGSLISTGTGESFVTYRQAVGLRPLASNEYQTTFSSATATQNVSLNASPAAGQTGKTINALRMDASGGSTVTLDGASGDLVVTSGALLATSGSTVATTNLTGFNSIKAGTAGTNSELVVHVTSNLLGPTFNTGTVAPFTPVASLDTAAKATLTVASPITDNGAGKLTLTKSGPGTLTLTNTANSFTGGININQGVLTFAQGALSNTSGTIRLSGGTLRWDVSNGDNITLGGRVIELLGPTSYFTPTGTGAAGNALGRGNTFDVGMNSVTLSAAIGNGGTGGLVKVGPNTLTLSAAPNYKGGTVVMEGFINLNGGTGTSSGLYLIPENTLQAGTIDIVGSGTIPAILPKFNLITGTVTGSLNVQQLIVGGRFTNPIPTGPTNGWADDARATLTLNQNAGNVGVVQIGNGNGDSYILVGYHDEGAANSNGYPAGASNASIIVDGSPVLNNPNTASVTSGRLDLSSATSVNINVSRMLISQNKGSGASRVDGDVVLSSVPGVTNNVTAGVIVIGNSPGANSLGGSGGFAASLTPGNGMNVFHVDSMVVGGQNSNGRVLLPSGGTLVLRDRAGTGGADLFIGDNDDNTSTVNDNAFTKFDVRSGTADVKLNQLVIGRHGTGAGGGQGTFSFGLGEVDAFSVLLAKTSNRGTSTAPLNTVAEFDLDGGTFRFGTMTGGAGQIAFNWIDGTIGNYPGADGLNTNVNVAMTGGASEEPNRKFSVEPNHTLTFGPDAILSGSGFVSIIGGGDLILQGKGQYQGNTTVKEGRLFVSNSALGTDSATGTGLVIVNLGATVGGTGRISGADGTVTGDDTSALYVKAGGIVRPGPRSGGIGTMAMDNGIYLDAGAILNMEINTAAATADRLDIGDVNLGTGNLILDPDGDLATAPKLQITDLNRVFFVDRDPLVIMRYGSVWDGGLFEVDGKVIKDYTQGVSTLADTFTVTTNGQTNSFWIDYDYLDPNDNVTLQVALVAVPEPGALASLIGGVGMLVGLQRFRRWGSNRS